MPDYTQQEVDIGVLICELEMQRDDALGTLKLREADVRYWKRQYTELKENVARLTADLFILTQEVR